MNKSMQDLDRSPPDPKPTGKAKGTNKAGCYTCRIRRKVRIVHFSSLPLPLPNLIPFCQKCDEKPDAEGNCQTCVRLRLQCLGFGEKRPDLMLVRLVFFFLYRVSQHSCREIMLLNFERRLRTFSTLRVRLRTVLASRAPPATMESLAMKTKRICVLMLL